MLEIENLKEIDERLRRRYMDRLELKVKKLRKLLVERNWEDLRNECGQLASSGETFGFPGLTQLAVSVQNSIPQGKIPRAATPTSARENTEALITAVDDVLIEHNASSRP